MLIHQAAAVTGLTIDTIRYYERQHLLDERHITRQPNGYRSYASAAIERLLHLKHARAQGYTVAELRMLTAAYDAGRLDANERRTFLKGKIARIDRQIALLEDIRRNIEHELSQLRNAVNPTTWVKQTNYHEQAFQPSRQAFTAQRAELLALLQPVAPEAWMRTALVTGAGKPRERTVQMYAQWLANHEQSHIRQIERIVNSLRI
jgi:DNA-binding transcriptional MerR regulator